MSGRPPVDLRVAVFGDSFVNGTGCPDGLGWVGRVTAAARHGGCNLTTYNLGIRRDTSHDIAARWREETARRMPAGIDGRLVFSFGVNDCVAENGRPRVAFHETLAATEAMLAGAQLDRPVLMVGPPPMAGLDDRIARLSVALAALCDGHGIPYLDIHTPLAADPVWRAEAGSGDGAHPGAAGYARLAALVIAWPAWQDWVVS